MKFSKFFASFCLITVLTLPFLVAFPAKGYAWQLTGSNQTVRRSGPNQNWNFRTVNGSRVRAGGHAIGSNNHSRNVMTLRIQAFRPAAGGMTALSFASSTGLAAGQRNIRTSTQLGCSAPWLNWNHPFRVQIEPHRNFNSWTGAGSIVRTH